MPHAEDYEAALMRMGIDPKDYAQVSKFQTALREKIGSLTRGQQSGFSGVYRNITISFPSVGINTITYKYMEKWHVRYTVPGHRGLFGYARAQEYAQELPQIA